MMIRSRCVATALTFSLLGIYVQGASAAPPNPRRSQNSRSGQGHATQRSPVADTQTLVPEISSQLSGIPVLQVATGDMHNNKTMLVQQRRQDLSGVDACAGLEGQKNFLNSIQGAVRTGMTDRQIASDSVIDPAYGLPGRQNSQPVSLISNPICEQSADQIAAILTPPFAPSAEVVSALKAFSAASNRDRRLALQGDTLALAAFEHRMTQLMGCLSYEESLMTAEDDGVEAAFQSAIDNMPAARPHFANAQGVARRPSGVLFAEDRHGDFFNKLRASRANGTFTPALFEELKRTYKPWPVVGMYQFNPKGGNTGPCVEQWNEIVSNPACKINPSSSVEVMRALSSPGQTFNTFCGVQKVIQAFNSQVNTNKLNTTKVVNGVTKTTSSVDPSNIVNGVLKQPKDRCVSLVARSGEGNIYSHFGPLRNSVKDNLGKLVKCAARATN